MKSEEIIQLIEDRSAFNEKTPEHLKTLLDDYPYFQTAHLLYLMNLQVEKDSEFVSQLRITACYANDRRKLFLLVNEMQFESIEINRLEKPNESEILESPFELVDFFLAEKSEKNKNDRPPIEKPTKQTSTDLVTTDYLTYLFSEDVRNNDLEVVPMQHQETIDTFLKQDAISPVKIQLKENNNEELFPIPDLDTVGADDFFSETLAKIYLKQKKYEKALEIIRKLNLVYPEKNIYFADQIRFLEKLIINTKKIE